jgi:hypothetical protein
MWLSSFVEFGDGWAFSSSTEGLLHWMQQLLEVQAASLLRVSPFVYTIADMKDLPGRANAAFVPLAAVIAESSIFTDG